MKDKKMEISSSSVDPEEYEKIVKETNERIIQYHKAHAGDIIRADRFIAKSDEEER